MTKQIQEASKELYDLFNKVKKQEEVDILLKEIKENGLDLCSIQGIFTHSILGSFIFKENDNRLLLNTLFKKNILENLETPPELISPWIPAAFICAKKINDKIFKQLGNVDTTDINKWYQATGLGDGHTLSVLLFQFQYFHSKKNVTSSWVKHFPDDKLNKFTSGPLKTLLNLGVDVNLREKNNHSNFHPLHFILGSQNYVTPDYLYFLEVVLQHGFDFNKTYDYSSQNNYIQFLFNSLNEPVQYKCNMNVSGIINIMHKITSYQTIDLDYKNKKGQTVFDIMEANLNHFFKPEDKSYLEQLILNKSIEQTPVLSNKNRL